MNKDNLILFFDTETTGLPNWKEPSGDDSQPHIVEIAGILVNEKTKEVVEQMSAIVKPDGWEIPQETIDVHGITNEKALAVGLPEFDVVADFLKLAGQASGRVAHNTTFDNRIIRIATKRYFPEEIQEKWKAGPYKCTGLMSKPIMQMLPKNRFGFKMPKLEEAYEFFTDKKMDEKHRALADAEACMSIYFTIQGKK